MQPSKYTILQGIARIFFTGHNLWVCYPARKMPLGKVSEAAKRQPLAGGRKCGALGERGSGNFVAACVCERYLFFVTRMPRLALQLSAAILAVIAIFYSALYLIVPSSHFRVWAEAKLSATSGAVVRIASLQLQLPLGIVAENVEVAKPQTFSFTSRRLSTTFSPLDLFFRTIHRLEIENPELELNIEALARPADQKSAAVSLRYLKVRDGRIALTRAGTVLLELPAVNLEAENFNLAGHSGANLRADIPPLNAEMQLALKGTDGGFQSDVVLRRKSAKLLDFGKNDGTPEMLRLRASFDFAAAQKPSATVEAHWRDLPIQTLQLTGGLNANIEADANFSAARFAGKIELDDFLQALGVNFSGQPDGKAAANFAGVYDSTGRTLALKTIDVSTAFGGASGTVEMVFAAPQIPIISAVLRSGPLSLEKLKAFLPAPLDRWGYQGQGSFELEIRGPWNALEANGSVRSDRAQVRGDGFAVENLALRAPFIWLRPGWRIGEARLRADKLSYGEKNSWQALAERLQAHATAEFVSGQPIKITGGFETPAGKFSSADASRLGENLKIDGSFDLRSDPANHATSLAGTVGAAGGEILWGKFFTDLKGPQPRLEVTADYRRDLDRLDCRRCRFILTKIGAVEVSGSIERVSHNPELRLEARSADFLPGGFYELLRPSFNREYPLLDRLALAGGLDLHCRIQGNTQSLRLEGDLALKNGMLGARPDGWQVGPITLSLPLQISWPQKVPETDSKPRFGLLTVEQARFGEERVGKIAAAVALSNNALIFPQTIRVEVFGGAVEIGALRWPDAVNDPRRFSFSAEVKNLRLDRLTPALGWPPFSGTLSGSIPQVQSTGSALQTNGEIRAAVFGGEARLGKLEVENPFSSLAAIRLDSHLSGIDLEQVTQTFSFGRISGILEGSIDNLVIVDGQPAEFQIDLHSVERDKEQRISVEALNKITVLSSGANAGALYGGLAGFFDNFGYSKLGFKARLKNDRLTLRGIESRGDEEFLVVGSFLPPRVNVVSHTQEIAFSELLRRLERIKAEPSATK